MMQLRLYLPADVPAPDDWDPSQRTRLRQVVTRAITRAAGAVSRPGLHIQILDAPAGPQHQAGSRDAGLRGDPRERIDESRRLTGGDLYGVPSYDMGGDAVGVPINDETTDIVEKDDGELVTPQGDRVVRKMFDETAVMYSSGLKYVYAGSNPYVVAKNLPRALEWGRNLFGGMGFVVFNPKHATAPEFWVVGLTEPLDMQEMKGLGEAFEAEGLQVATVQRRSELIQQKDFHTVLLTTRQGDVLLTSRLREYWNLTAVGNALNTVPRSKRFIHRADLLYVSQRLLQSAVFSGDDQAIVDMIVNWDHTLFSLIPWETREHYVELLIKAWTGDREEIAIIEIIKSTKNVAELEAIFALLRKNDLFDQLFDDLDGRVVDLLVMLSEFRPGGAVDWKYLLDIFYSGGLISPISTGSGRPLHDLQIAASGVLDWLMSTYDGVKMLLTKPDEVIEGLGHLAEFIWVLDKAKGGDPEAIELVSRMVLQAGAKIGKAIRGLEYAEELGSPYGARATTSGVGEDIMGRLRAALTFEVLTWFIGIGEIKGAIRVVGDLPRRLALLADALKALAGLSKLGELGTDVGKLERVLTILARVAEIAEETRVAKLAELMPREQLALLQRVAEKANLKSGADLNALKLALAGHPDLLRGIDTLSGSLKVLDRLEATAAKAGGLTSDMIEGAHLLLQAKPGHLDALARLFSEIAPEHLDEFTRTLKFLRPEHFERWGTEVFREISQRPKALSLIREAGGDVLDRVYARAGSWENVDRFADKLAAKRAGIGDPAEYQRFVDRLSRGEIAAFDEVVGSSLVSRQLAAKLRNDGGFLAIEIKTLLEDADKIEARAARKAAGSPEHAAGLRRAAQRRRVAKILEADIADLERQALELDNGLRSAAEDLPDPSEIDRLLEEARAESDIIHIPLADTERSPNTLPRLTRELMRSRSGNRVVFRVEGPTNRQLLTLSSANNVTIARGASVHLNFGSFDRAVEFAQKEAKAGSRIVAFEVDEAWVQSVRSAAIPEHGTGALHGNPRLVDIRFAEDQMEIPADLLDEFERFIVPGTGRVIEVVP